MTRQAVGCRCPPAQGYPHRCFHKRRQKNVSSRLHSQRWQRVFCTRVVQIVLYKLYVAAGWALYCHTHRPLITYSSHSSPTPHTHHLLLTLHTSRSSYTSHSSPTPHTHHLLLTLITYSSHSSPTPHTHQLLLTLLTYSSHSSHTYSTSGLLLTICVQRLHLPRQIKFVLV